jgi:hypothetical protein
LPPWIGVIRPRAAAAKPFAFCDADRQTITPNNHAKQSPQTITRVIPASSPHDQSGHPGLRFRNHAGHHFIITLSSPCRFAPDQHTYDQRAPVSMYVISAHPDFRRSSRSFRT